MLVRRACRTPPDVAVGRIAGADAKTEPVAGHVLERGNLFRRPGHGPEREQHHAPSDRDPLGQRRGGGEDDRAVQHRCAGTHIAQDRLVRVGGRGGQQDTHLQWHADANRCRGCCVPRATSAMPCDESRRWRCMRRCSLSGKWERTDPAFAPTQPARVLAEYLFDGVGDNEDRGPAAGPR